MKRVTLAVMALMVFILPLTMSYNQLQVNANIASKPLTITAKKVAKDLAKDSAVAMANDIVSNYLVRELIEGATTESGYAAVCMDGPKDNIKDCPVDKRAQVKKELTSSDRSKLASTVENVLEKKTNTSHKWQKFLDFFIPIFLISGLVATFDAMLDGDSESLIDEIAQESLINAGFLKPLTAPLEQKEIFDFTPYVTSVTVTRSHSDDDYEGTNIKATLKPGVTLKYSFLSGQNEMLVKHAATGVLDLTLVFLKTYVGFGNGQPGVVSQVKANRIYYGDKWYYIKFNVVYQGNTVYTESLDDTKPESINYWVTNIHNPIAGSTSVNDVMNAFITRANLGTTLVFEGVTTVIDTPPEVQTDYGTQTGLNKTKNPDGTKTLPGVDSFTYIYNNNYVYPATDSTTGWKDKTTGEDTTVVEDDVIVEDGTPPPTDPETPPGEEDNPNTDKDKDKVKDKSRKWSALLTDKFPFSLPWDFLHLMGFLYADPMTPKYEIRGTEKIPLNFTIDLKFFDSYAPWFRSFIFISFVVSVIFMHGRFMGGAK